MDALVLPAPVKPAHATATLERQAQAKRLWLGVLPSRVKALPSQVLARRRPEVALVPLRKRIANLFLQFLSVPELNPAAYTGAIIPAGFC